MSGSPFDIDVTAGPPRGANSTVSGSALILATAGENSSFVIQARDGKDNPTTKADDYDIEIDGFVNEEKGDAFGSEETAAFNVTLKTTEGDNSTVVTASVQPIGKDFLNKSVFPPFFSGLEIFGGFASE